MAKYASLRRVRLTRDGYVMRGQGAISRQYRGISRNLYRCETPAGRCMEFRGDNRAEVVIQARKWLSGVAPGLDVRS